ncbi:unnamed protein product [Closterium sp. Naga37s-1]|nr:unnamed protein product [Closterium sp. Naga37s-1]
MQDVADRLTALLEKHCPEKEDDSEGTGKEEDASNGGVSSRNVSSVIGRAAVLSARALLMSERAASLLQQAPHRISSSSDAMAVVRCVLHRISRTFKNCAALSASSDPHHFRPPLPSLLLSLPDLPPYFPPFLPPLTLPPFLPPFFPPLPLPHARHLVVPDSHAQPPSTLLYLYSLLNARRPRTLLPTTLPPAWRTMSTRLNSTPPPPQLPVPALRSPPLLCCSEPALRSAALLLSCSPAPPTRVPCTTITARRRNAMFALRTTTTTTSSAPLPTAPRPPCLPSPHLPPPSPPPPQPPPLLL